MGLGHAEEATELGGSQNKTTKNPKANPQRHQCMLSYCHRIRNSSVEKKGPLACTVKKRGGSPMESDTPGQPDGVGRRRRRAQLGQRQGSHAVKIRVTK